MQFKYLLDTLARSSPQAVATWSEGQKIHVDLKKHLYVETEIEKKFREILESDLATDSIVFLCGSSGDGKSEILKRYYEQYNEKFRFHVDATHAFKPDQNAIDSLDQLFDEHYTSDKPLVIGINVGMLFNFASQGHSQHEKIKNAIEDYLTSGKIESSLFIFLNFEDYPKFSIEDNATGSDFVSKLISRIVSQKDDNPIYRSYLDAKKKERNQLIVNYELLYHETVRNRIVQLLLFAMLRFGQFLSVRAILDFMHHLISGPGWLFDNLFIVGHNDLSDIISHFDPCSVRSQRIDQFLIQYPLGVEEDAFKKFKQVALKNYNFFDIDAASWLRFFYLFQDIDIEYNYHKNFINDFRQPLYEQYINVWMLHKNYNKKHEEKQRLREFYKNEIISALMKFGNRLTPSLTDKKYLCICSRNGFFVSARAEIKPDFSRIYSEAVKKINEFPICLKIGDKPLKIYNVNICFLELVFKINNGYRPNKHDKNTIVILEEMIGELQDIIVRSNELTITNEVNQVTIINEHEDEEFVVGGAK